MWVTRQKARTRLVWYDWWNHSIKNRTKKIRRKFQQRTGTPSFVTVVVPCLLIMILAIAIDVNVSRSPHRIADNVVRASTKHYVRVLIYSTKKQFNLSAKSNEQVRTFSDDAFPEKVFDYWLNGVTWSGQKNWELCGYHANKYNQALRSPSRKSA